VTSANGRGWQTATAAIEAIDAVLHGELALYVDGPTRHGFRVVAADASDPPGWLLERLLELDDPRAFAVYVEATA
jgi:hypothetical protein